MREFWFERGGVRLCAVEDGNGRPIVMLHGGLANHWTSLGLVGSLSPRFRVVTPDLRGSGKSHDGSPLTWDRLADDVVALMDHIGVDRAVVGGVSSGAGAAVRFGLRHPRKVAGLVIVTPVYGGDELGLTAEQTAIFRGMDDVGSRAVDEGVQVLRPLYENLPPPIRERALAMVDTFDAPSVAATTHFLASGAQPFVSTSELRGLVSPTLLVPGNDAMHPAEISERYAALIPGCEALPLHRARAEDDLATAIGEFCERSADW
ncbi:MAG TPA: alpha/beta hydrolase [Polyangiaceae bacterium]|nr:alpha/beta hydrolase [Polyangiaceae bacterium]